MAALGEAQLLHAGHRQLIVLALDQYPELPVHALLNLPRQANLAMSVVFSQLPRTPRTIAQIVVPIGDDTFPPMFTIGRSTHGTDGAELFADGAIAHVRDMLGTLVITAFHGHRPCQGCVEHQSTDIANRLNTDSIAYRLR